MRRAKPAAIAAITLVLVAGLFIYSARRPEPPSAAVGVVRATEVRVEPEGNGQLEAIAVEKGAHVHAGDILARLSAVELTAQADQARARPPRPPQLQNQKNFYACFCGGQVNPQKAEKARASARLEYAQAQLTR